MLTADLLAEFESKLREFGAPVVDCLEPGCTAEQLDRAEEALGLTLPTEVRLWWQWHDGAERALAVENGLGLWALMPLEEAVDGTLESRSIRDQEELGNEWWDQNWLEFVKGYGHSALVIDCAGDDVAPVVFFDAVGSPDRPVRKLQSIGDLVELWMRALELSAWTYNDGAKEIHPDRWPNDATKVFALD